jgi:RHS repeat-associated protein
LNFGVPESAITTNPPTGDIPIYDITNAVHRSAMGDVTYLNTWGGKYLNVAGERTWLSMTQDVARGVYVYRLTDPDSRLIWQYESTNRFFVRVPLVSVSDYNSNQLTFAYSTNGMLTNLLDSVGRLTRFQYDAQRRCTNMIVPTGFNAAYRYDTNSNLIETRDLLGSVTHYSYDANNYPTNMTTEGKSWSFTWQTGQYTRLYTVIDPLGRTTTYDVIGFTMANRFTQRTDPDGAFLQYVSSNGMTGWRRDAIGGNSTTVFSNGWPTVISNALGNVERRTYDSDGRLTRKTDFAGGTTTRGFNELGLVAAVTDSLGRVWRTEYDAHGNVTNRVAPSGRTVRMTYDTAGRLLTRTDSGGRMTQFDYDSFGNVRSLTDPGGNVTRFGWDSAGIDLLAVTNARGAVWRYEVDANRRRTRIVNPDGTDRRFQFDCCAESAVVDERGATNRVERDPWQNVTRQTDPLGHDTRTAYDVRGHRIATTNAAGTATRFQYNAEGWITNRITELGDHASFAYDAAGRCVVLGPTTNAYPDPLTGLLWTNPPEMFFSYDGEGRMLSCADTFYYQRDALGIATNLRAHGNAAFRYDEDGRLTAKLHDGVQQAAFTYNSAGDLVSAQDSLGTTTYGCDARGLVTNISYPGGWAVGFEYDAAGYRSAVTYPDGLAVRYSRNSRNWVTNVTWLSQSVAFQYDGAGNLLRESRSSGVTSEYACARDGSITNVAHRRSADTLFSLALQRDVLGSATNIVFAGIVPSQPVFTATNVNARYNQNLSILNRGSTCYTHGWDKNLDGATGDVSLAIAYDAENRPVSLARNGVTNLFVYGANGRCVRSVCGAAVRQHFHDHLGRLLFETDGGANLTTLYLYRDADLVAQRAANGRFHFYHSDANGNILALTDDQGKISAIYRYLPYGEAVSRFARVENPFTFMGRFGVRDVSNGVFMTARRFYDARTGRFLQYDPIGPAGGLNPYEYAGGNPVNRIDPWGADDFFGGMIGFAYGGALGAQYPKTAEALLRAKAEYLAQHPIEADPETWLSVVENGRLRRGAEERKQEEAQRCEIAQQPMTQEQQAEWDSLPSSFSPPGEYDWIDDLADSLEEP